MKTLSGKIAWNTIVQAIGKIASTSLGLLITVILTRYLGPTGFGDYTFVLVFVLMFGSIADWGLALTGISEASKNAKDQGKIVSNLLLIRLFLATIAMILASVSVRIFPGILPHSPNDLAGLILIASAFIFIFSLKTSFQIIFNVQLKMQYWAISELAANGVGLLLVLLLVLKGSGLSAFVWTMSLGQLISMVVAMFFAVRMVKFELSVDWAIMKRLIKSSLPVGALLILFTVYNRADIILLGHFKGAAAVGYYGVAYRVYEVLVLGAAFFANSVLPILSNLAHTDMERFRKIFIRSYVVLLFLGIFVALLNLLFAPLAIAIIGGPEYSASVPALQILSLAIFISYFNHLNGYAIIALSKQWYSFVLAAFALGVNLVLNIILIPRFSLYGAAFTTFLTEGLIVILSLTILRKTAGVCFGAPDLVVAFKELYRERYELLRNFGIKQKA